VGSSHDRESWDEVGSIDYRDRGGARRECSKEEETLHLSVLILAECAISNACA
jgi:hypothetical protein